MFASLTPVSEGLRERKKARTRATISDTAMALFLERGFDRVTVAEVAREADVSTATVFNYFPAKEDLFFDRADEVVCHLADVVRTRAAGESFVAACRRDMLELIRARDWRAGLAPHMADFHRMVDASPTLQARSRLLVDRSVAALAEVIADELTLAKEDVVVATTAWSLVAARTTLLAQAQRGVLDGVTPDDIADRLLDATNRVFNLLERGFHGLGH